jgi:hypothetical protein
MKFLNRIPWFRLSPLEKVNRILSLEVLRKMRVGSSLTSSSKDVGLSIYSSRRFLGNNLLKIKGRWKPTKTDSIQRSMRIYTRGKIKIIIVDKSKYANIIGEYFNGVRNYLESGSSDYLKPFKKKPVYDYKKIKYPLETNPQKVRDIEERKEDSEFFEIYSDE